MKETKKFTKKFDINDFHREILIDKEYEVTDSRGNYTKKFFEFNLYIHKSSKGVSMNYAEGLVDENLDPTEKYYKKYMKVSKWAKCPKDEEEKFISDLGNTLVKLVKKHKDTGLVNGLLGAVPNTEEEPEEAIPDTF